MSVSEMHLGHHYTREDSCLCFCLSLDSNHLLLCRRGQTDGACWQGNAVASSWTCSRGPRRQEHGLVRVSPIHTNKRALTAHALGSCKEFNARTTHLTPDTPTPVIITIAPDRTFKFDIRTPPTSYLIKQAAGISKGTTATSPGPQPSSAAAVGSVSLKHVYEIARIKGKDQHMRLVSLENIAKSVVGTCKSMGAPSFVTDRERERPFCLLTFFFFWMHSGVRVVA